MNSYTGKMNSNNSYRIKQWISVTCFMVHGGNGGAGWDEGPCRDFSKKDSKSAFVVQVYFLGEVAVVSNSTALRKGHWLHRYDRRRALTLTWWQSNNSLSSLWHPCCSSLRQPVEVQASRVSWPSTIEIPGWCRKLKNLYLGRLY